MDRGWRAKFGWNVRTRTNSGSLKDAGAESTPDVRDTANGRTRFWDVDAVRGVAIIMVALYHLVYDLDNLAGFGIESTSGFWGAFADTSAFMFVFLAGLSLTLSYTRSGADGNLFGKYLRRGLKIFTYGMLITLAFWALSFGTIVFGILHLIGLSIILAYPFLRLRFANLFLGLLLIVLGLYMQAKSFIVDGAVGVLLSPLGVVPENLFMPDYRPLLPWFGVVLLGIFFGNVAYLVWRVKHPVSKMPFAVAPLALLGRHTLFVYLVHQPIIVAVLFVLGMVET